MLLNELVGKQIFFLLIFFYFIHSLLILYVINFSYNISGICISIGYEKCFVCVGEEEFAFFILFSFLQKGE